LADIVHYKYIFTYLLTYVNDPEQYIESKTASIGRYQLSVGSWAVSLSGWNNPLNGD